MKIRTLIFVLLVTTCLYSTIINVPGDQPTIQEGIVASTTGDTVLVADGTYYENIDFLGNAITVASNFLIDADTLHIENTIINGSQPDDPDFGSCAMFLSGEDTTSVITGFTLTEGTGTLYPDSFHWGGGIMCDNSSPMIVSNIIMNNSADYSSGIDCSYNASPIILNNVISYNTATVNIGGLTLYDSNAHVEGNIISNNTAIAVGGVLIQASSPTFVNNIICDNTAATVVGGLDVIHSSGTDRTRIENCYIYGNTSGSNSGGLQVWNANVDLINCTINDNHSGQYGGGVGIFTSSDVTLSYTSIIGNSASDGGGVEIDSPILTITNCTIYGNVAPGFGSQIDCWSGGLEADNSIIGGNSTNGSVYFNISTPTFEYCDFYNSIGPEFDGPAVPTGLGLIVDVNNNGDPCDEFMNIFLDPLFVDPINDDFHLTEFSPCIDAGDPESPPDPDGSIADIGRYYYVPLPGTEDNEIVQTQDYLHQNYPNPFNPTTTINYQLPVNSKVELTVYNLKGQKVKALINETLESGNHTVIWNGKDDKGKPVSSGIYFYKMKTDNYEEAKKMILLK